MMPESCARRALYSTAKMDDFAQNAAFESDIAKEGFSFRRTVQALFQNEMRGGHCVGYDRALRN
jgi:hypothetical protein